MGDDAGRWIVGEIAHVRRTTRLAGPRRLAVELAAQAYLDAHVPASRDRPLARREQAEAWLATDGRQLYMAMGRQKDR